MTGRPWVLIALGSCLLLASSASATTVITFDGIPTGLWGLSDEYEESGFKLRPFALGDLLEVVDLGGGDHALKDSVRNGSGALVRITTVSDDPFWIESLSVANDDAPGEVWCFKIYGYRGGTLLASDQMTSDSAGFVEVVPPNTAGLMIDELRVNIVSADHDISGGGADYIIDNVKLAVIPEPMSMLGLLLAAGAVGRYTIRRRLRPSI